MVYIIMSLGCVLKKQILVMHYRCAIENSCKGFSWRCVCYTFFEKSTDKKIETLNFVGLKLFVCLISILAMRGHTFI